LGRDAQGHLTFLGRTHWRLEHAMEEWPEIEFHKTREHA
jgi:peptide chain release factor 3